MIVDDDPHICSLLTEYLSEHGFLVTTRPGGGDLDAVLAETPVDLVILDLNLPGEDGLSIARRLRSSSDVPIIMLTGEGHAVDRIIGLELGADDYIAKPFNIRELLARVKAVLRRRPAATAEAAESPERSTKARFADWVLNFKTRRLISADGAEVLLTRAEFGLLAAFVERPGRVLSRDQILDLCRVHSNEVFDRSVDVQILRLRRKIEADPRAPSLIRTERGAGYVFTATVERF